MPIKPRDFLTQAQLLIQTPDEVDHRSAISRSYYAALHGCYAVCRDVLSGTGLSTGVSTHQKVVDALQSASRDTSLAQDVRSRVGALSYQLIKGRNLRVRADYKINGTISHRDAVDHIATMARTLAQSNIVLNHFSSG